jgi:hypothetical protein
LIVLSRPEPDFFPHYLDNFLEKPLLLYEKCFAISRSFVREKPKVVLQYPYRSSERSFLTDTTDGGNGMRGGGGPPPGFANHLATSPPPPSISQQQLLESLQVSQFIYEFEAAGYRYRYFVPSLVTMISVLRIGDVYPGSRILIFTHPGSRIPDPGSKNSNERQG